MSALRIERHRLGPRLHVLGRRVHEYEVGLAILAAAPRSRWAALAGAWLVIKDWPDLFPATRDRATWRLGIHRLSAAPVAESGACSCRRRRSPRDA